MSKQTLVDTMTGINMHNGVVRMYFVGLDPDELKPQLQKCIAMPMTGFIYAMTIMENFVGDERVQAN